jgi:hypothetical protein
MDMKIDCVISFQLKVLINICAIGKRLRVIEEIRIQIWICDVAERSTWCFDLNLLASYCY